MSASLKQLLHMTREAIMNHPLAINPPVLDPTSGNQIFIEKFRHYDGSEFISTNGLTCSIFPYYFKSGNTSGQTVETGNVPLNFGKQAYSGSNHVSARVYEATANIVVKVHYPAVALGPTINLEMATEATVNPDDNIPRFPKKKIVPLQINPAEEIVTDWIENIRLILDDPKIRTLSAFGNPIVGSKVQHIILNTVNWEGGTGGQNIFFHEAYLLWSLTFYPNTEWDYDFYQYIKELYLTNNDSVI